MAYYRIKNWEKYQHYKDRSPPWIKLHRDLLTSETWVSLDNDGRVLAIACMMIASATENKIPAKKGYIRRAAYLDNDPDFQPLIEADFVEYIEENTNVASAPQADASKKQADARPEERRGEERREDNTADADQKYSFSGKIVNLTEKDFDAWSAAYPNINLRTEIQAYDDWLVSRPEKDQKAWFFRLSGHLKNQSKKAKPILVKKKNPDASTLEELATWKA